MGLSCVLYQRDWGGLWGEVRFVLSHIPQGKFNLRSLSGLRLDPDATAVALNRLAADGQPDPRAFAWAMALQALERHEDLFAVLGFDPAPVVGNPEYPLSIIGLGGQVDAGLGMVVKFDRFSSKCR